MSATTKQIEEFNAKIALLNKTEEFSHKYNVLIAELIWDSGNDMSALRIPNKQDKYLEKIRKLERKFNKDRENSFYCIGDLTIDINKLEEKERRFLWFILGWINEFGEPIVKGIYMLLDTCGDKIGVDYYLSIDRYVDLKFKMYCVYGSEDEDEESQALELPKVA